MQAWLNDVEVLIDTLDEGDVVEFEYTPSGPRRPGNTVQKRGEVLGVYRSSVESRFTVDVGGKSPWKLTHTGSVSVSYDHARDGKQTRHLGRVEKIRKVEA